MKGEVMAHIPDNVPKHMHSTYMLLRSTYPEGIPDKDYFPLLAVMADTGMSNRSIAEAMGLYLGKEYIEFLHDVAHVLPNTVVHEDEKCRILRRLQPHGFEQWAQED